MPFKISAVIIGNARNDYQFGKCELAVIFFLKESDGMVNAEC